MGRYFATVLATALLFVPCLPARAADGDAKSILDKAIKALGGEEKLAKAEASHGNRRAPSISTAMKTRSATEVTVKGLDHFRREFGNDQFHGVVVLAGDKGWRKFGDNFSELEGDASPTRSAASISRSSRSRSSALKGKGFKYEAGGEEKVGDKPAVILKVTGPDGKDFTLSLR